MFSTIAEHLGDVTVVEIGDPLRIDDEPFLDNEVRHEGSNELAFVENLVSFLLFATNSLLPEFDDERPLAGC